MQKGMKIYRAMKKIRKKPVGKSGFTLVELIVVIVIILVLAAVLIPNVVRFIEASKKSAFQIEAYSYMIELVGYEAEYYAKTGNDLSPPGEFIYKLPVSDMKLTRWDTKDWIMIYNIKKEDIGFWKGSIRSFSKKEGRIILLFVNNGSVIGYAYSDGQYSVEWFPEDGWSNII